MVIPALQSSPLLRERDLKLDLIFHLLIVLCSKNRS